MIKILKELYDQYSEVKIQNQDRYFNHDQLLDLLNLLSKKNNLDYEKIGESENGLDIFKMTLGNGPIKVMAWSQMHGNEVTGTLALLEFLDLLTNASVDISKVWDEITFVCITMVNPDGAQAYSRRNGYAIDINRDAVKKVATETQLLINQLELEKPDIALNLHDQRNIFGVSGFENPATLSFLAPSFNVNRDINECRAKCMKLIASLANGVNDEIGNFVGRYSDEFYPTAFGEYVQGLGIPCILIESGAHLNDPNREIARKMNVYSIFRLFSILIDNGWKNRTNQEYLSIPENNMHFFDLIIKNVKMRVAHRVKRVDIGLLVLQKLENGNLIDVYQVADIGDLDFKYGLETFCVAEDPEIITSLNLNESLNLKWKTKNLEFVKGIRK